MQRIAVGVEPGQLDTRLGEGGEVFVAGIVGGQDVVDRGHVDGRKESADVDLCRIEAEIPDHGQGFGQRAVVENGGVDSVLHTETTLTVPLSLADSMTASRTFSACRPSEKLAQRGREAASE